MRATDKPLALIALLTVALFAIAATLLRLVPNADVAYLPASLLVAFPLVTLGFFLAERFVFHVEFRREAISFSPTEIPLAYGLVFLTPHWLALAWLLGASLGALRPPRPPFYKLVFNLAVFALEATLSATIARRLVEPSTPPTVGTWFALLVAIGVAMAIGSLFISIAVSLFEGGLQKWLAIEARFGHALYLVGASTGVLCVLPAILDPRLALIAVLPMAAMWAVVRAHGELGQRHRDLEKVHSFSREVGRWLDIERIAHTAVEQIRAQLRAERALLVVSREPAPPLRVAAGTSAGLELLPSEFPVAVPNEPRLVRSLETAEPWLRALAASGAREAIVSAVSDDAGILGFLVVVNRVGAAQRFGSTELTCLGVLLPQLALNLRNGRLHEALGRGRDELERRAEQLRRSEERYRLVVQSISDVLYVVDFAEGTEPGQVTFVSDQAKTVTGRGPEEILGPLERLVGLIDVADRQGFVESTRKLREGEPSVTRVYRIARPDGDVRWLEDRSVCRREADGRVHGFFGVVRDITQRKRFELALQASEEQLRQSQKMDAIGRLAGGVAHDFNNLLTVILGQAQLELDGDVSPRTRESLGLVMAAGERAAKLTRQLLAFSRKQRLAPEVLNLNALLGDLTRMLPRLIGEDIEMTVKPASNLGTVRADPGQLEQVLLNLVVNARDAMPKGGKLEIRTANEDVADDDPRQHLGLAPGAYVQLVVRDTGCGMDEETQARIFEPFFTTKGEGRGTGLGLATVYGVVKQTGGHVEVKSAVGEGSTFTIYLPRVNAIEPEEPPLPEPRRVGSETILVVEDEDQVRAILRQALAQRGYRVWDAPSGEAALSWLRSEKIPIDLLITDVVMPRMDGHEVANAVRELFPTAGVIYVSGYTAEVLDRHGLDDKSIVLLEKPFRLDEVLRVVRSTLDARPSV
ncbi:MAG: ATP-binding protein [bacterium]